MKREVLEIKKDLKLYTNLFKIAHGSNNERRMKCYAFQIAGLEVELDRNANDTKRGGSHVSRYTS